MSSMLWTWCRMKRYVQPHEARMQVEARVREEWRHCIGALTDVKCTRRPLLGHPWTKVQLTKSSAVSKKSCRCRCHLTKSWYSSLRCHYKRSATGFSLLDGRQTYRFGVVLSSSDDRTPRGRGEQARCWPVERLVNLLPPSKDLLGERGRSKTRKDDSDLLLASSRALPDDLRRANPFGILMGIYGDIAGKCRGC